MDIMEGSDRRPKGCAIVWFDNPEDARKAIGMLCHTVEKLSIGDPWVSIICMIIQKSYRYVIPYSGETSLEYILLYFSLRGEDIMQVT